MAAKDVRFAEEARQLMMAGRKEPPNTLQITIFPPLP